MSRWWTAVWVVAIVVALLCSLVLWTLFIKWAVAL